MSIRRSRVVWVPYLVERDPVPPPLQPRPLGATQLIDSWPPDVTRLGLAVREKASAVTKVYRESGNRGYSRHSRRSGRSGS